MHIKNLTIGKLLGIGFGIILFLVITLGIMSDIQTHKVHKQTELIYDHPLQTRRAIGALTTNIHQMRLATRDLMLAINFEEQQTALELMEMSSADAMRQFEILFSVYSGPISHVEEAYQAFITWKSHREANNKLALSKDFPTIKESVATTGNIGILRDEILQKINIIDEYSKTISETIYKDSFLIKEALTQQLLVFIGIIVVITLLIYYLFLYHIRAPLLQLTNITRRFDEGELSVRNAYESKSEIGLLASTFNSLAENIENNSILNTQTDLLSDMLLIEDDPRRFFRITLQLLMEDTRSQIAAVYLLSEDKKQFEQYESIGLDKDAKKTFSSKGLEGETGFAITTRKIHHLKELPEDTRFVFNATVGKFVPLEMITIPILSGSEVIAIVTIASMYQYNALAVQLIYKMHMTYCARVDQILTYQKVRLFSGELAYQNRELESQKIELIEQSRELTQQNRELASQKEQLTKANHLKTSFLSNMSHELRTPLNSVIALSGVLSRHLKEKISAEEYSYLEVIERNGKNLLNLINGILDIARIESGHEEIETSTIYLQDCINDVITMLQPQAKSKAIELDKVITDDKISIQTDAQKLTHILQNLISNAVKFTEQGEVTVAVTAAGDNAIVSITDTGIGISEDNLPHIFDEFRQVDEGNSRKYGGTGLGLAIAKKYANFLGGYITVISKKGIGSEFTLTLPIVYSEQEQIIEEPIPFTNSTSFDSDQEDHLSLALAKTVLIVEDSEAAIIQLKDILEDSGYQIIVARDGNEGIKIMNEIIPDAIILDLMIPGIDGFELLQTIRDEDTTAHVPVLILSAKHISQSELDMLKRNHIYQLIQKGDINKVQLLDTVKSMVVSSHNDNSNGQR